MGTVYNYSPFNYKIIRRKRKTIGIKITEEGEIVVISPLNIDKKVIDAVVKSKEKWIKGKLTEINEARLTHKSIEFKSGEELLYLGENIALEIFQANIMDSSILISDKLMKVFIGSNQRSKGENIRDLVINFYKKEARRIFLERTIAYKDIIGVYPKRITVKDQKTVWGSCSSKGNLNYNYRLLMAPIEIIDYVVVHELCHLRHMNHSKQYWGVVQSVLPDYEERRQWLKVNGNKLRI
ncbi:SprT family zinc-dependent metalloprotease [Clostridium sp. A1-XYC3]|uniref:SprT family zinc-dependent metalloprotease n=1 Tax=Clostridium tanneri TaxID=3037988 RepID=A0ABU4JVP1_9CLOT|nr:SprT family zinc-dependent metalloprotease [Clostridium sp. A1-XYC3]MDW8802230.1 SprT family zinc-dependent metalloprotease [Clostridium sp. A1-XYC3]